MTDENEQSADVGREAQPEAGGRGEEPQRFTSRAYSVDTVVVEERGQWAVEIVVLFDDEVVRKRIAVHRTRRLAEIAANLIKRAAERDIGGPIPG